MPDLKTFFNDSQIILICVLSFATFLIAIKPKLSSLINNLDNEQMFSRLSGLLVTLLIGFLFVEGSLYLKIIALIIVPYVLFKEAKKVSNLLNAIGESLSNAGINLLAATSLLSIFTKEFNDTTVIICLFISLFLIIFGENICVRSQSKNQENNEN